MSAEKVCVKWTPFALTCLNEIHDYIYFNEKSVESANEVINAIFKKVDQLTQFPESGQKEPILNTIGQDSRFLLEFNYKIIYEFHSEIYQVVITDVFHTSQNPEKVKRTQ